jgi:hypothetical protein
MELAFPYPSKKEFMSLFDALGKKVTISGVKDGNTPLTATQKISDPFGESISFTPPPSIRRLHHGTDSALMKAPAGKIVASANLDQVKEESEAVPQHASAGLDQVKEESEAIPQHTSAGLDQVKEEFEVVPQPLEETAEGGSKEPLQQEVSQQPPNDMFSEDKRALALAVDRFFAISDASDASEASEELALVEAEAIQHHVAAVVRNLKRRRQS